MENLFQNAWKFTRKQPHAGKSKWGSQIMKRNRLFFSSGTTERDLPWRTPESFSNRFIGLHKPRGFSRHRVGSGVGQTDRASARRAGVGGGRRKQGCDVLLYAGLRPFQNLIHGKTSYRPAFNRRFSRPRGVGLASVPENQPAASDSYCSGWGRGLEFPYFWQGGTLKGAVWPRSNSIILDLYLPKMSGTEVLRRLRADPRTQALPVAILTITGNERGTLEQPPFNVKHYLRKPLELNRLPEVFTTYLHQNSISLFFRRG